MAPYVLASGERGAREGGGERERGAGRKEGAEGQQRRVRASLTWRAGCWGAVVDAERKKQGNMATRLVAIIQQPKGGFSPAAAP